MNNSLSVNSLSKLLILIFLSSVLFSCKSKRKIINQNQPAESVNTEFKNTRTLLQNLKKNEVSFKTISAKFDCTVLIDSSKTSFDVNMRAIKDSAIWMNVSIFGITGAKVLITKDTVKFIDTRKENYFIGDFNYISKLLQADLDYELLQSLLIGNSVEFYEEDDKMRASVDGNLHLLSTTRKRKLRKVIEKNKELKEPVQSIWLQPENYKITRIMFNEFATNRSFDAIFYDFQKVDSVSFPYKIDYTIKAEKKITISVDYDKVQFNKEITFPFTIPPKYERIVYEQKKD